MITALQVKELREMTGAGMMDCKKALEHTNGNLQEAIDYLREKGIAKAANKQSRIAAEGLTNVVTDGNTAIVYEVNSETDFVAKNDKFLNLIDTLGDALIKNNVSDDKAAHEVLIDGKTIDVVLKEATATIGEKITLRRVTRVIKNDNEVFGAYRHMGGKITVLTVLEGSADVAKDIAMHVAANKPQFLDRQSVDPKVLEHEKHILTEQALQEGKPAQIVEKMVVGRLQKFLQEICLVDQPFLKDPDQTVAQYLKSVKATIKSYLRLEVGEGIEKRSDDFAAEVASQLKK